MERLQLVIGNKRYSSWSMRPWLVLAASGLAFEEKLVPFSTPNFRELVNSPTGKVPVLHHGELTIAESLAIVEYIAELAPNAGLWPDRRDERAVARSLATEMHAGFATLRRECPMDTYRHDPLKDISEETRHELARIGEIWSKTREQYGKGGHFLFGHFGIVDAMFAPVALRCRSYGLPISGRAQPYLASLLSHPLVERWVQEAKVEEKWVDSPTRGVDVLRDAGRATRFAEQWADAWNRRDLETILGHYAQEIHLTSPRAAVITGNPEVHGREALRAYWTTSLEKTPLLRFAVTGVVIDEARQMLVIEYLSTKEEGTTHCAEVLVFGDNHKVVRSKVYVGAKLP